MHARPSTHPLLDKSMLYLASSGHCQTYVRARGEETVTKSCQKKYTNHCNSFSANSQLLARAWPEGCTHEKMWIDNQCYLQVRACIDRIGSLKADRAWTSWGLGCKDVKGSWADRVWDTCPGFDPSSSKWQGSAWKQSWAYTKHHYEVRGRLPSTRRSSTKRADPGLKWEGRSLE